MGAVPKLGTDALIEEGDRSGRNRERRLARREPSCAVNVTGMVNICSVGLAVSVRVVGTVKPCRGMVEEVLAAKEVSLDKRRPHSGCRCRQW